MNDLEIYYKISRSFPEEKFTELEKYYNKATRAVMEYLESIPIEPPVIKKNADNAIGKEVSVPISFMRQILDKYLTHYLHTPNGKQFEHWERLIEHLKTDLEDYEKFGIVEDVND